MNRVKKSQILVKNAKLSASRLRVKGVTAFIEETKRKQAEVLKLKDVDQDRLRMVVQL